MSLGCCCCSLNCSQVEREVDLQYFRVLCSGRSALQVKRNRNPVCLLTALMTLRLHYTKSGQLHSNTSVSAVDCSVQ